MPMFRPDIPPHVSEIIRHLSPDLKGSIKAAIRALCVNPKEGEPLVKEIGGIVEIPRQTISHCVHH